MKESEQDPTVQVVRPAITSGDWSKLQGTTYKAVRDELWIMGQLVMRGTKVFMPEKLWNQTIQLVHEGHHARHGTNKIAIKREGVVARS